MERNLLVYEREHLERLRGILGECTVLLKGNGAFPLAEAGKLALYGSGARHTIKGGTGSGEVNSRFFVNVEEGLEEAGFQITTKAWLDGYEEELVKAKKQFVKDVKALAKEHHTMAVLEGMGATMPEPEYSLPLTADGDVAVYVLSRISGEGGDRKIEGDIRMTETETRDILALSRMFPKFMLVINAGGPVDLSPVMEVPNILVLSQLGVETGSCLADLLLGKAYPSGKLTTTWVPWEKVPAIVEFGNQNDTRYREGIYVGYRYYDSVGEDVLFPFGYGKSYTTFEVAPAELLLAGEQVTVRTKVTNTGSFAGKEVVQVYVSVPAGKLDQPYQTLAGFMKTPELAPGENILVDVAFTMSSLASYDAAAAAWILEAGNYIVRVGADSRDTTVIGAVEVEAEVCVRKVKNAFGTVDFTDWKPENARTMEALPETATVLKLDAAVIETEVIDYDVEDPIDPIVRGFSDDELCLMNVGSFDPKKGALSVIGDASKSVAGAAGETTDQLKFKGVPVLVMADGPAGLRLSQKYAMDEKGVHSIGETIPATIADWLSPPEKFIMSLLSPKPKKNAEIRYQYATAIPVGTAIAQSFNPDVAVLCGDVVGEEMVHFDVHLWLAPALNIHRSIRCGRNYEYYSEDPLVSGVMAAGITKGVQAHPGCGTTIKHFCANNQELNRYMSNSIVSERALREIYLRGFEIAVKTSQPHALMTSYNLLNGVHTSERRDLTTDVLRREWGYLGIVMTDWVVNAMPSKGNTHRMALAGPTAAAGGDLYMPGTKKDVENVRKLLSEGGITRKQLQQNATRVYRMAKKLTEEMKKSEE